MKTPVLKILVTGGRGFIGKALAIRLAKIGHKVYSISRNECTDLNEYGINHIQTDIVDFKSVLNACKDIDVVFHVAAKVGIWGKYKDFYNVNIIGTENIISACKHYNIGKLIFTSSASVVFDGSNIINGDETLPYPENPISNYTATKAIAEKLILNSNSKSLKTISLRPHIVWGPGDTNIIPGIVNRARNGKLTLIDDGLSKIDITYIDNLVDAHICALDRIGEKTSGNAYFITDNNPIEIKTFINSILEQYKLGKVERFVTYRKAIIAASIMEFFYKLIKNKKEPPITKFIVNELSKSHYFDISKAKKMLEYTPGVSFEQGLKKL